LKKQLVVDYTQENASLQIFPFKPLLSINKPKCNIQLEYHKLPANEVQEHLPAQNVIVILHDPSKKVQRRMGGKCKDEFAKPGDIVISPANVSHYVSWDEEASFSLLLLDPKYFVLNAYELADPDRVELLPYFAQPDPVIYGIGQMLKAQLESGLPISQMYIDQLVSFLSAHLLENYCSKKYRLVENSYTFSAAEFQRVLDYFDAFIDQQLCLAEISNLLGMSQYHFARLFKKSIGIPPAQYFMKRRLKKTAHLLATTNSDLGVIAAQTGFTDQSHFCRTFRQHFSVTPRKYRRGL
jgi:AraC family transcriptional regulator